MAGIADVNRHPGIHTISSPRLPDMIRTMKTPTYCSQAGNAIEAACDLR